MKDWEKEALFAKSLAFTWKPEDFDSEEAYAAEMQKRREFEEKWGFSYVDTWNLEGELAVWLLPRIAYFRENSHGYPLKFAKYAEDGHTIINQEEAEQQWDEILKKICDGLHGYLEDYSDDENQKRWETAKKLLFEYYDDLWD
jgi:hypothetical protein